MVSRRLEPELHHPGCRSKISSLMLQARPAAHSWCHAAGHRLCRCHQAAPGCCSTLPKPHSLSVAAAPSTPRRATSCLASAPMSRASPRRRRLRSGLPHACMLARPRPHDAATAAADQQAVRPSHGCCCAICAGRPGCCTADNATMQHSVCPPSPSCKNGQKCLYAKTSGVN